MPEDKPQKEYSASQKLRFALFDLWNAKIGPGKMPFEQFYQNWMEREIGEVRDEIAALSNPDIL